MRIPAENGHASGSSGYWRLPSRPPQPKAGDERDVEAGLSDDLPQALETVTRLGLKKMAQILRTPLDISDGNLVRAQVTAAIGAVNAQLRADEQQLRTKKTGDVLDRLAKLIEEETKKLPPEHATAARSMCNKANISGWTRPSVLSRASRDDSPPSRDNSSLPQGRAGASARS